MVALAIPVGAMTAIGGLLSLGLLVQLHIDQTPSIPLDNPFRVGPALLFGALFAGVLLIVDFFNTAFGDAGVYGTALLAGTIDTNAITLSLSALTLAGDIAEPIAVNGIVFAVVVNTLVKVAIIWIFGTSSLGRLVAGILSVTALIGVGVVLLL